MPPSGLVSRQQSSPNLNPGQTTTSSNGFTATVTGPTNTIVQSNEAERFYQNLSVYRNQDSLTKQRYSPSQHSDERYVFAFIFPPTPFVVLVLLPDRFSCNDCLKPSKIIAPLVLQNRSTAAEELERLSKLVESPGYVRNQSGQGSADVRLHIPGATTALSWWWSVAAAAG